MPLERLEAFTKTVSDLDDKPNATMTAAEVKAQFDAAPNEVREYLNKLIDVLQSDVDGDSGADNIKATPISTSPDTVQGILEWLNSQIGTAVLGQIPDGTITQQKLAFDPMTQEEFNQQIKSPEAIRSDNKTKLVVEVRTTDPVSPEPGRIWFRSDL